MKVSYKKSSIVVLSVLILISVGLIYFTKDIRAQAGKSFASGPTFYPILLAGLMILFCILSIIDTCRKEDKEVELPNVQRPVFILAIVVVWVILWQTFGFFYVFSTIAIAGLLLYLNPEPFSLKKVIKSIIYDLIIVLIVFLIFAIGLKTQL